jgi:hypothetical protein
MPDGQRLVDPDCFRIGYVRPALPGAAIAVRCWRVRHEQVACRVSDADGAELTKVLVGRSGEPSDDKASEQPENEAQGVVDHVGGLAAPTEGR